MPAMVLNFLGVWNDLRWEEREIREPETTTGVPEPEVEVQRLALDEEMRVAIVGAGGYGRVTLDVLLAGGLGDRVLGFYDDAQAAISVEAVHVVVAITVNTARLRVANSLRGLGGQFYTAVHPLAYLSAVATIEGGCVAAAGVAVHPDSTVGSHCFLGPGSVVEGVAGGGGGGGISAGGLVGWGARGG